MPKPLLNFRNVRLVIERIGGRRSAKRMGAKPLNLHTGTLGEMLNNVSIDAPFGASTAG